MKKIASLVLMMHAIVFVSKAQIAGAFDSTFANDGMAIYNWQENYFDPRLIEQPDGKLLIRGSKEGGKYFIIRINSDSTLDAGFGINGFVEDSISGFFVSISTMHLEPNGNIIVSLIGGDATFTNQIFGYARYLGTGIIDSTFGINGYVLKTPSTDLHYRNSISPAFNNQYVIAESVSNMSAYTCTYERLNYDGTFDATFGNAGSVILPNFIMESTAWLLSGKFIFFGFENFASGYSLIRFHSNGVIDSSYGINGIVLEPFVPGGASLNNIFTDSAGNAYTFLQFGFPNWIYRISKFDATGVKDAGFGIAGDKDLMDRYIYSIAFEPGGKIIAGGSHFTATGSENFLQRWLVDGSPDATFVNAGELLFTSATQSSESILSVLLSPSGKIYTISSGYLQVTQDNFFFVSRFHNDLGTGINDAVVEQSDFIIYPNPASTKFTVYGLQFGENEKAEIKIFDVTGKEILKSEARGQKSEIDLRKIENGMYSVQVNAQNKSLIKKLIVQH